MFSPVLDAIAEDERLEAKAKRKAFFTKIKKWLA